MKFAAPSESPSLLFNIQKPKDRKIQIKIFCLLYGFEIWSQFILVEVNCIVNVSYIVPAAFVTEKKYSRSRFKMHND
jgi:hypothetical protein